MGLMMGIYIEHFILLVCSFYVYAKLLNLKWTFKQFAFGLVFISVLSLLIYYISQFFQPLTVPILIVFSFLYITLASKTEPGLSITATILSFGISFVVFLLSSLLVATIFSVLGIIDSNNYFDAFLTCSALFQILLSFTPFRFRRLKSGMPFLRSKGGGNIGVVTSTVLLCCFVIISNANNSKSLFFIIPAISVFLCGVLILIWWRIRLKKAYIEKLRAEEFQDLRDTLQKKEEQIKDLQQHNDFLAKVIHKDNKLIPSMELAVREYLTSAGGKSDADFQLQGQMLLAHLNTIFRERSGIITEYQSANEKLPHTGVFEIDTLMSYMFNKSKGNGIKFEFIFSGSIKFLIGNIVPVSELRTLLADMIENAIIATKSSSKREILVSMNISGGYYIADVFDSGIPFEPETIINFGCKMTTTHAGTGGSGIGLITISEILNTYHASFIIEEFSEKYTVFTKKVSAKFDNLNQFIVKARNDEEVRAISARENSLSS